MLKEVTGLSTFGFQAFNELKVLEISKKDISEDWKYIVKGLPKIPSAEFTTLRLKTDHLSSTQL